MGKLNELEKSRLENRFKPLETAIKAQNALAYSGKQGGINTFLKSFAQLPVDERQAYLSNPGNRANYMKMLEDYRLGINSPTGGSTNVLSPEYVKDQLGGGENLITSAINAVRNLTSGNNANNAPVNQMNNSPIPQGQEFGENNRATDEEVAEIAQNGNGSDKPTPTNPIQNTNDKEKYIAPNGEEIGTITPDSELYGVPLSEKKRDLLTSQLRTNNKGIAKDLQNRADNGIAFESYLQEARPKIARMMADAAKYQGVYGRGKGWLDALKANQPEEYANYIAYKNSIIPILANGVRFLEKMGISHEAQEEAAKLVTELDQLALTPETSMKVFNKTIESLYDLSEGVLKAAEPAHPGVRRQLAGVKHFQGDYVAIPQSGKSAPKAPAGRMNVIDKEGRSGTIPESSWSAAQAQGYRKA